jgi:hypothetical protein
MIHVRRPIGEDVGKFVGVVTQRVDPFSITDLRFRWTSNGEPVGPCIPSIVSND